MPRFDGDERRVHGMLNAQKPRHSKEPTVRKFLLSYADVKIGWESKLWAILNHRGAGI